MGSGDGIVSDGMFRLGNRRSGFWSKLRFSSQEVNADEKLYKGLEYSELACSLI